ncbi:low affinity immunoglobulin gamma Fc region receptor III-like isoform X1 [Ornithorhynchus anatinus]|uniref:low affinity immunoglobulin gamma Fc region receptor III-like isoform X1 n=1 Tax=Ornithorhynchus anatinus TaxID=9258 RepID=UPI0019D44C6E|nr:low affinity immunoglobulin gamma Fc region receptor III-like isoform X1 [Ornithorhynchus anatinus]
MWLLVALSVLATGNGGIAGAQKSRLTLHPKWVNMFTGDKVTLKCDDPNSLGNITTTHWFHNGTALAIQAPSYSIRAATFDDTGEYECQMGDSQKSDSVWLDVSQDWLLLQTSGRVFLEGEHVHLRCRSWKNQNLVKVTFYKDQGIMRFYSHNSSIFIPHATHSNSGSYFCRGFLGQGIYSSLPVKITVRAEGQPASGGEGTTPSSLWIHIFFYLAVGILFAIDTGLYVTLRKRLCTRDK